MVERIVAGEISAELRVTRHIFNQAWSEMPLCLCETFSERAGHMRDMNCEGLNTLIKDIRTASAAVHPEQQSPTVMDAVMEGLKVQLDEKKQDLLNILRS